MDTENIGYSDLPKNSNGIQRARTTCQVRSWHMMRGTRPLQAFRRELETVQYPALYLLFEKKTRKVYVGEAENIHSRLSQHISNPDDKIKDWTEVLIISDGRPITQSLFNNRDVRLVLEAYLNKLLKANKYDVVANVRTPTLDQPQQHIVDTLLPELNFFLQKRGIITRLLEEQGQQEVYVDELKVLFQKRNIPAQKWEKYEAVIEGHKAFIRPGSKKKKGWQITSRGRKSGSFIDCLQKGAGYLIVPRDGVLFIPLTEVKKVIPESVFKHDTVDIWIVFTPEKATLSYKKNVLDVTQFRILS